jgi:carbonic anhydrase/acetyltransferase-like protein (isoleucine patch superfamily)
MTILPYKDKSPKIDASCFIAPQVVVVGDVEIGKNTNVWYGCVLRGDVNEIRIGENTNIQDGTVIHVATFGQGSYIGDRVTVGHMALIHACTIEDDAFIGMKAIIMDGAKVEKGAYVAAGALVTPGKVVKSGEVWAGSPAKYMRDVNEKDLEVMNWSWDHYVKLAANHVKSIKDAE